LRKAEPQPTKAATAKSGRTTPAQAGASNSGDRNNEKDEGRAELRAQRIAEAKRVDAARLKDERREQDAAVRARADKKQHR
jgi:hypothetical protein